MQPVGYAKIHELTGRGALPPAKPALISPSVNRRIDDAARILFPSGVRIDDSLIGHVEFALRHENVNLALLKVALEGITRGDLAARIEATPNAEFLRKACFLWEWFREQRLEARSKTSAGYVPMLDPAKYVVVENPDRMPTYRVLDNLLGNPDFCPVVGVEALPADAPSLRSLVGEMDASLRDLEPGSALYERAITYLLLEETRKSYRIEREDPTASKEDAFVRLLRHVAEREAVDEDWLVDLQNLAVRDDFSREASFRTSQNFMVDNTNRVTFFPPAAQHLRKLMDGWMRFANDETRKMNPVVKAACVSFGFVFLHPFNDGNGRLHRFLLQHALARSGELPEDRIIPVSAVFARHLDNYAETLKAFSRPVTSLWEYRRAEETPLVVHEPGPNPYAYWDATRVASLTQWAIEQAIRVEIPNELRFLATYDSVIRRISSEHDLPSKDLSTLVRGAIELGGPISQRRRKQHARYPAAILDRIAEIVREELKEHQRAPGRASGSTHR
jgi:hypothetical protein